VAAGRFYLRQPNTNRYVSGAYYLSLNGPDVEHFTVTGSSSSGGALSGAFDATHGGVFAVMQNGSTPVAACPANEDGTLRLGAEAVPENFPPAVMASGAGILRFIGTLDENNVVVACYANASAANSTEASDGAGCVLKINPVSGAVTLCNYVAGSTSSGGYSVSTHLFQTGVCNSLSMPLVGVDPNANNLPWSLSAPAEGPAGKRMPSIMQCAPGDKGRYKFLT